jgi:hypothetical protein
VGFRGTRFVTMEDIKLNVMSKYQKKPSIAASNNSKINLCVCVHACHVCAHACKYMDMCVCVQRSYFEADR